MPVGLRDVRDIVAGTLRDVEAIFTSPAVMRELSDDLANAERILAKKLRDQVLKHGTLDARFSGAQALAFHGPVSQAVAYVQERITGRTAQQAEAAIGAGLARTVTTMEGLEQRFTGIATPIRLRQAAQMSTAKANARGMWAREFPTSVDRYGTKMLGEFEEIVRAGFVAGSSMDEVIAALTGHGGPTGNVSMRATVTPAGVLRLHEEDIPEGLFVRHKYWAERLVRTEMLRAYNGARQAGLEEMGHQFPDMKRKILATFDKRTAPDSVAVHGQIRGLKEPFVDGAGRMYLYPPGRPNDRETVIPWRDHWEDSAANMSEWEKVAVGEGDSEAEKRLEAALTGNTITPRGLVKLTPAQSKTLAKIQADGEHLVTLKKRPTHEALVRAGVAEFYTKPEENHQFQWIRAIPGAAIPPTAKPPTKRAKVATINEKVEAELRRAVKMDQEGYITVDGINAGFAVRDYGVTPGDPLYIAYHGGKQIPNTAHPSGRYETRDAAAAAVTSSINQQLAKAAQSIKPWNEAAYFAAIDAGDLVTARHHVRGLLYENGVFPRDLFRTEYDTITRKSKADLPDALATHGWDGKINIRIDTLMDGKSEHAHARARHLAVQVHEELHGATRYQDTSFYQGHGAVIEEVSVEMAARHITQRAMPSLTYTVEGQFGSYQHIIDAVAGKIAEAEREAGVLTGTADFTEIKRRMALAGIAMRSAKGAGGAIKSKDGILALFAKHASPRATKQAIHRIKHAGIKI